MFRILLMILVAVGVGRYVVLPYSNHQEIWGPFALKNFNPATNWVRVLFVVTLTALIFLIPKKKNSLPPGPGIRVRGYWPVSLALIFLSLSTGALKFLEVYRPVPLDLFHEGERLSGAWNFVSRGGLWQSTFLSHGAIRSALSTVWGWHWFSHYGIGIDRLVHGTLWALVPVMVGLFLFSLSRATKPAIRSFAFIFAGFLATDIHFYLFYDRDVFVLLSAMLLILGILRTDRVLTYVAGLVAGLCFCYALDRGSYLVAASLSLLIVLALFARRVISAQLSLSGTWALGLLSALGLFTWAFGVLELQNMFSHWRFLAANRDFFYGDIFPDLGPATIRYWIPIFLLPLNFVATLAYFPGYVERGERGKLVVTTFLLFLSAFYLRSALVEININHVKYASGFGILCSLLLLNEFIERRPQAQAISWIATGVLLTFVGQKALEVYQRQNDFAGLKAKTEQLVSAPDADFLDSGQKNALAELYPLFSNENCLVNLADEPAWFYLLRKPSCLPFILPSLAGSRDGQQTILNYLKAQRPFRIITSTYSSTPVVIGFPNEERLKDVFEWVKDHYQLKKRIANLEVYEMKAPRIPYII